MDRIIVVVGGMGSGKGMVGKVLEKEFGFVRYPLSGELKHLLLDCGADHNELNDRETLQNLGDDLREEFGLHVLAELSAERAEKDGSGLALIDGVRSPEEAKFLKEKYSGKVTILAVEADQELRRQRVLERNREGDPKTKEEFLEKDERELFGEGGSSMNIDECIKMADIRISNEGTREELEESLMREMSGLGLAPEGNASGTERLG